MGNPPLEMVDDRDLDLDLGRRGAKRASTSQVNHDLLCVPDLRHHISKEATARDPLDADSVARDHSTWNDMMSTWEVLTTELKNVESLFNMTKVSPKAETFCGPSADAFSEVFELRKSLFFEDPEGSLDQTKASEVLKVVKQLNLELLGEKADRERVVQRIPRTVQSIRERLGPARKVSRTRETDDVGGEREKWEKRLEAEMEVHKQSLPSLHMDPESLSKWMVRMGYRGDVGELTMKLLKGSLYDKDDFIHKYFLSELD